jgi:hypothetical protein
MSFYETYREYVRIIEEIDVTELGTYKKNEVPDGSEAVIRMAVVHHVTLIDEGGKLLTLWFDIPEPKDKEGDQGGGYSLNGTPVIGHHWWKDQTGPSDKRSALTIVVSNRLTAAQKATAEAISAIKAADPSNPEYVAP